MFTLEIVRVFSAGGVDDAQQRSLKSAKQIL
jgi:hypothetical protein